jgi:FkbM family methyltransferase
VLGGSNKAIICGFGAEGQKFASELRNLNVQVAGIYDDNLEARSQALAVFPGADVGSIEDATNKGVAALPSCTVFACSHSPYKLIEKIAPGQNDSIIPLYAAQCLFPDLFKPFVFYDGMLLSDRDNDYLIDYVANLLEDSDSKEIFRCIRKYRREFKMCDLASCVNSYDEMLNSSLFAGTSISSYVDGGPYDGDTIDSVIQMAHNKLHVDAFEPSKDMATYLRKKYEPSLVTVHEAAISSVSGTLAFDDDSSRTSMISSGSENYVRCVDLDTALAGRSKPIDFIKLNIEGAELDALRGAKRLIRHDKPVLAIHSYHRPSHIWEIPLMIKSINPSYRLYFRQQDHSLMESVFFAFPD